MPNFAKDVQLGDVVLACNGIKKRKYVCLCPDAQAAQPVCFRHGDKNVPHFAHIPVRGPNGDITPSCRSGGESEEHMAAKHKLVEWQGHYNFALKTCKVCSGKVMEDCKNGTMKLEVQSDDKQWRYDVLYTRSDGSKLALEVYHTHATGDEKVRSSTESGIPIAELDAGAILDMAQGGTLDNKRDSSWICSRECHELKRQREIEAKRQMLKRQREIEAQRQAIERQREIEAQRQAIERQREMEAKRQAQMRADLLKEQEAIRAVSKTKLASIADQCQASPACTIVDNGRAYPVMHHYRQVPWSSPYATVNNGRALSYGHQPKPELTLSNHPPPSSNTKFDYTVPIMGQPSDYKKPL